MKKNLKKNVLSAIAKVGEKSAVVGASSASILGFHQPKEPKALKNLKKQEQLQILHRSNCFPES